VHHKPLKGNRLSAGIERSLSKSDGYPKMRNTSVLGWKISNHVCKREAHMANGILVLD